MTLEALALQGRSKTYSTLAASVTARILELRKELIRESLSGSQQLEHRMEVVANIHGIEFINDSAACTLNSTWFALESMNRPVIWITGGSEQATDYTMVKELVEQKVKALIMLGDDSLNSLDVFRETDIRVIRVQSMKEAVETSYHIGKTGDAVLLSPACASFNLFENFEERGNAFKQAVRGL